MKIQYYKKYRWAQFLFCIALAICFYFTYTLHYITKLSESNCKRCCAALTHGGRWRGEIAVTTDGSDPWWLDCQSSDASAYYECKQNEHGDAVCSERHSLHDEF